MRVRPRDDAGGVRDAALQTQRSAQRAKAIELQLGFQTAGVLGIGQMRQQSQRACCCTAGEPRVRALELLRAEAQPVHPGVELQPDGEAVRTGVLLQHGDLLERMDDELQLLRGRGIQLIGAENTFEHDNGMRDACGPQLQGFVDARDAESIRIGERTRWP